jgi:hypothetical protein
MMLVIGMLESIGGIGIGIGIGVWCVLSWYYAIPNLHHSLNYWI